MDGFKKYNPAIPKKMVMISWLMLPSIVSEITFILFPSRIYKTRPRYSPTRFGVVTENETPEKIAFNAVKKLTGCTFDTDNFHFNASSDQFTNMSINTSMK